MILAALLSLLGALVLLAGYVGGFVRGFRRGNDHAIALIAEDNFKRCVLLGVSPAAWLTVLEIAEGQKETRN